MFYKWIFWFIFFAFVYLSVVDECAWLGGQVGSVVDEGRAEHRLPALVPTEFVHPEPDTGRLPPPDQRLGQADHQRAGGPGVTLVPQQQSGKSKEVVLGPSFINNAANLAAKSGTFINYREVGRILFLLFTNFK